MLLAKVKNLKEVVNLGVQVPAEDKNVVDISKTEGMIS